MPVPSIIRSIPRLHMIKRVARHLIGQMLHLRVKDQELTMKGVEDFCKGTEFLKELDPTKLHPEIMKMGYAMQDVSDDLHKFGVDVEKTKPQPLHLYEDGGFAKKHLLSVNGWLLPAKKRRRCFLWVRTRTLCIAEKRLFYTTRIQAADFMSNEKQKISFQPLADVSKWAGCLQASIKRP